MLIGDFVVLKSEKTPSSRGFCRVLEKPRSSPDHFCPSCCGATIGSEQQHNQDFRKIYKGRRILEFITFYHNALHLTRVHCATFYQKALRQGQLKWKHDEGRSSFAAQTQSFLCGKFSTARLEVLTNLRHTGVFQMSTMVNLGIGFSTEKYKRYINILLFIIIIIKSRAFDSSRR